MGNVMNNAQKCSKLTHDLCSISLYNLLHFTFKADAGNEKTFTDITNGRRVLLHVAFPLFDHSKLKALVRLDIFRVIYILITLIFSFCHKYLNILVLTFQQPS